MAFGVVSNSKSCLFHDLYHKDVADNGHHSGRSGGVIPKAQTSFGFSCAEAYIGLVCQRTIRISGNNNKLEVWVQIMSQLC